VVLEGNAVGIKIPATEGDVLGGAMIILAVVAAMPLGLGLREVRAHPPNSLHVPPTLERHTPPIELHTVTDVGVPSKDQNGCKRVHGADGIEDKRPCRANVSQN
jgi:hypothetical protein